MMNRRHLLSLLPAAAFAGGQRSSAKPIAPEAINPAGFSICVQAYSFRAFNVYQAVEKAATAGADSIELYPGQTLGADDSDTKLNENFPDDKIQPLLEHCRKHEITVANYGVTRIPNKEKDARKVFELGKKLGVYALTTESVESMDLLEKLAKEYDVKVCIHNHPAKPNYVPGDPAQVWQLVKDCDPRIGYCIDIGHLATSGMNPLEIVKKVGPRIRAFHFKDRAKIGEKTRDFPFGKGILPIAEILDEAGKHGFAGNVSIEYEYNWENSVPEIAQCVGYLRGYAAGKKS